MWSLRNNMQYVDKNINFNFITAETDDYWNTSNITESTMHKIHAYPAKFPAFITQKAIEFAKINGLNVQSIADIFCGCGTVALEAQKNHIDFWGWDINPVAVLIAKVKSNTYKIETLEKIYSNIIQHYLENQANPVDYSIVNDRIKYWFSEKNIHDLKILKEAILNSTSQNKYRLFFLCAFSNILKATSKWLTKSIKPQIDPRKPNHDVLECFEKQYNFMYKAVKENDIKIHSNSHIQTANSLKLKSKNLIDLIVTSPPYVTSYEYADLHQLSSLWLNYTDDYRTLRINSVGSSYGIQNYNKRKLNSTAQKTIESLKKSSMPKIKSIAQYFIDMQKAAKVAYNLLKDDGMIVLVIGNTEYRGVYINNAAHLIEALYDAGFSKVYISKRKITGKILTPYRDATGKFAASKNAKEIYSEEFVVVGRK